MTLLPSFCPTIWTGSPVSVNPAPVEVLGIRQSGCPSTLTGNDVRTVTIGTGATELQDAIDNSINADGTHKGHTIVCPAGATYTMGSPNYGIVTPQTTDDGWTVITTDASLPVGTRVASSQASSMFKIQSSTAAKTISALVVPYGSTGWRFIGADITAVEQSYIDGNGQTQEGVMYYLILVSGARVSFERCYIHGFATGAHMRRGLMIAGSDVQVWDSWFSEWQDDSDSQTIWCINRSDYSGQTSPDANNRIHIENNHLSAAAEIIMVGDGTATYATRDVTVLRNRFFKPRSWQTTLRDGSPNPQYDGILRAVKNHFEVKAGHRILVEGNIFENSWGYGLGGGQPGEMVVLNAGFQAMTDMMFRSNKMVSGTMGMAVSSGYATPPARPQRIAFVNNLGLDCGDGLGFCNWHDSDVLFDHNTWIPSDGVANVAVSNLYKNGFAWQLIANDSTVLVRNGVRHNIIGPGNWGSPLTRYDAANSALTDAAFDVEMPDRDHAENAVYGGSTGTLTGFTGYTSLTAAGVTAADGTLTTDSPLKVGNTGYFGTDSKDIGVDHTILTAALSGTIAAPVASFTYVQAPGTYQVQFTDTSL